MKDGGSQLATLETTKPPGQSSKGLYRKVLYLTLKPRCLMEGTIRVVGVDCAIMQATRFVVGA